MIYNIVSGEYQKFGFASNFNGRKKSYITTNPNVQFLEGVRTYRKTKHRLEGEIHKELVELGYEFLVNHGVKTEWVKIKDKPLSFGELRCCKGRKVYALGD